ncbi:MAG: hypothetical protein SchgKO_18730 [Schleiferiaceae bacterium]
MSGFLKGLFVGFALCFTSTVWAQNRTEFWGYEKSNGAFDQGRLYAVDSTGRNLVTKFAFGTGAFEMMNPSFIKRGSNGKIYGVSQHDGSSSFGTIFEVDEAAQNVRIIAQLNAGGHTPVPFVEERADGSFLVILKKGGFGNQAILASFSPSSNGVTQVFGLGNDVGDLSGPFTYNGDTTKLYGLSKFSSTNYLVSIDLTTGSFDKMLPVSLPATSIQSVRKFYARGSKIYGITYPDFVLMSFDESDSTLKKEITYKGTVFGNRVNTNILSMPNGKLACATSEGGNNNAGVLLAFDPSNFSVQKIADLPDSILGAESFRSLTVDSMGDFQLVSKEGGAKNMGVILGFQSTSGTMSTLYESKTDHVGAFPMLSIPNTSGTKLLFFNEMYGSRFMGTISELDLSTYQANPIYDFGRLSFYGHTPANELYQASNGLLYGVTTGVSYRAPQNLMIYEVHPITLEIRPVSILLDTDSEEPITGIIEDSKGNLLFAGKDENSDFAFYRAKRGDMFIEKVGTLPSAWGYNMQKTIRKTGDHSFTVAFGKGYNQDKGSLVSFNDSLSQFFLVGEFSSAQVGAEPNGGLSQYSSDEYVGFLTSSSEFISTNNYEPGEIFVWNSTTNSMTKFPFYSTASKGYFSGTPLVSGGVIYGVTTEGLIMSYDPVKDSSYFFDPYIFSYYYFPKQNLLEGPSGKIYGQIYSGKNRFFEYDPVTRDFNFTDSIQEANNVIKVQIFPTISLPEIKDSDPPILHCFPNPSNGRVRIDLEDAKSLEVEKIKVYSITGQSIPFEWVSLDSNILTIDIYEYKGMAYILVEGIGRGKVLFLN